MTILGIDPGRKGGLVLLDGLTVLEARTGDGQDGYHRHAPRADPDPAALVEVLMGVRIAHGIPALTLIEAPAWHAAGGARMGATAAGHSGMEHGMWRAILSAWGWPYRIVRAQDWRRAAGITGGRDPKAATVAHVAAILPGLDLYPGKKRIPHDGLADAAGIALAGGAL